MNARLSTLPRAAQFALVAAVAVLVTVVGWFVAVAPKRSTAADLKQQTAAVQAQIDRNRSAAFARALPAVRSASVFSLAKAMPSTVGMPDVILELNQLATESGISFDEITPGAPTTATAFDVEPISMQFTGNYYNLLDFLFRVRNLVGVSGNTADTTFQARTTLGVHGGKLFTTGRMYAVSEVKFAEAQQKFPIVTVTLTLDTYELAAAPRSAPAAGAVDASQPAVTGTTPTAPTTTTGSN